MRTDLLLNEDYDLIDLGMEWSEGESDQQHVELLMISNKADWKEFPFVGFGARRRLNGIFNKNKIIREIRVELENDGYTNYTLDLKDSLNDLTITI